MGWDVVCTYFSHTIQLERTTCVRLDLCDRDEVVELFQRFRPRAVVHTAYSQTDPAVIVCGTRRIATAALGAGARLLHLSTDTVFDGERGWYREADAPSPFHPYGETQLEAEWAVAEAARGRG